MSVVVPCLNEVEFIGSCLDSILANDYPGDRIEILVVDGMSSDGTRGILADYTRRHPTIRYIDNPKRTTPAALNTGIASASGDVVIRMDAHAMYPRTYISTLVAWLERSGADNVGATCVTLPAGESATARAIAAAMSHPLGVGNSYFRIGADAPRWVDTVPFGCYRREVFDRVGLFDEDLVRNQDDEFNQRLIRAGGRILLVPDVNCAYYARRTVSATWRMFHQYGYWKPLVARKLGGFGTLRQLMPGAFVLVLAITGVGAAWSAISGALGAAILLVYVGVILATAMTIGLRQGGRVGLVAGLIFPVIHFAYGIGFLRGVFDFMVLRRSPGRAPQRLTTRT